MGKPGKPEWGWIWRGIWSIRRTPGVLTWRPGSLEWRKVEWFCKEQNMPLVSTKKMFQMAYKNGYAIGAFNVNNMEITQGIVEAVARELDQRLHR